MRLFINIFILLLMTTSLLAQANYDESKVPQYIPIDPLQTNNGRSITTTDAWEKYRRPQLLKLFAKEVYGEIPDKVDNISFEVTKAMDFKNGTATLREITCTLQHKDDQAQFTMLLLLPKSEQAVSVFLGLNFYGNHTIHPNENITLHQAWGAQQRRLPHHRQSSYRSLPGRASLSLAGGTPARSGLRFGHHLLWRTGARRK